MLKIKLLQESKFQVLHAFPPLFTQFCLYFPSFLACMPTASLQNMEGLLFEWRKEIKNQQVLLLLVKRHLSRLCDH